LHIEFFAIKFKTRNIIYYDESLSESITDEMIEEIKNELASELEKDVTYDHIKLVNNLSSECCFKINKTGDIVQVDVIEKK